MTVVEYDDLLTKKSLEENDNFEDFLTSKDHPTKIAYTVIVNNACKNLKENEIVQLERRGFYRCDRPDTETEPAVLILIPDGKKRAMSKLSGVLSHKCLVCYKYTEGMLFCFGDRLRVVNRSTKMNNGGKVNFRMGVRSKLFFGRIKIDKVLYKILGGEMPIDSDLFPKKENDISLFDGARDETTMYVMIVSNDENIPEN